MKAIIIKMHLNYEAEAAQRFAGERSVARMSMNDQNAGYQNLLMRRIG